MANPQQHDPLEELIADGRIHTRPLEHYGIPEILTVDLDLLAEVVTQKLLYVFLNDNTIRNDYMGNAQQVTQMITNDTTALVNYALGQTYNRLRNILELKRPDARLTRMNTRCPVPVHQEFPAWLSSTLSCIGPCRLSDGASDTLIVYASSSATMNNYGRANPVIFHEGNYARITGALRRAGVRLAPFDYSGLLASYFPTISCTISAHNWMLYGQVHHSHYENEDLARIALVTNDLGRTPFENVGVTIGYVDDRITLDALSAVAAPADIPAGQDADSAGRPVAGRFRVNYFGIQPGVQAQGLQPARNRGMYVLGRGVDRYYQCVLAHNIGTTEVLELLRYRLMRTN